VVTKVLVGRRLWLWHASHVLLLLLRTSDIFLELSV